MELEKFIEEDIKRFLEERTVEEQPASSTEQQEDKEAQDVEKDSGEEGKQEQENQTITEEDIEKKERVVNEIEKELRHFEKLLNRNDIVAAIYLYKHLKGLFNEFPEKFYDEKKELYKQLIPCYYRIREAVAESDLSQKTLEKTAEPEVQPQNTEQAQETDEQNEVRAKEAGKNRDEDSEDKKEDDAALEDHGKNEEDSPLSTREELLSKIEDVRSLIKHKKARQAVEEYEKLKDLFEEAEGEREVSEEIFKDILSVRKSIRKLEEHTVNRKHRAPPEDIMETKNESLKEKVIRKTDKAYKFLDKDEVKSAVVQYNELRKRLDEMSIDDIELKNDLKERLMKLHDAILEEQKRKMQKKESGQGNGKVWDDISRIKHLIENGKIDEAQKKFIDVQSSAAKESKSERKKIYKALDSVKSKLHLAHSAKNMERMAEA